MARDGHTEGDSDELHLGTLGESISGKQPRGRIKEMIPRIKSTMMTSNRVNPPCPPNGFFLVESLYADRFPHF